MYSSSYEYQVKFEDSVPSSESFKGILILNIVPWWLWLYILTDYYPYLIANSEIGPHKVIVSPKVNFTLDS